MILTPSTLNQTKHHGLTHYRGTQLFRVEFDPTGPEPLFTVARYRVDRVTDKYLYLTRLDNPTDFQRTWKLARWSGVNFYPTRDDAVRANLEPMRDLLSVLERKLTEADGMLEAFAVEVKP